MKKYLKSIGPGAVITAAFIGPGTVTTCIKSGYETGYSLLGIMIIAILVAIVIQIFAAKIGIVTQVGLSKNIRENTYSVFGKVMTSCLIAFAIFVGNSAFEAGNITGGVIGITGIMGSGFIEFKVLVISTVIFALLWRGKYKRVERILEVAVLVMATCFIIAAVLAKPNLSQVFKEMINFEIINKNFMMIGALIGTTVGPYSIFLHSEIAAERWHNLNDIKYMVFDTIVSIGVGGIISCCIIIVAAATAEKLFISEMTIENFGMALSAPIGKSGQIIFYLGLLAAGVTSAITAPLAAAYTIIGIFSSKNTNKQEWKFKIIWILVLLIGTIVSVVWGNSPAEVIIIVQFINSIVLPIIMIFLFRSLNNIQMKKFKNTLFMNIVLLFLIVIFILLGLSNIIQIFTIKI